MAQQAAASSTPAAAATTPPSTAGEEATTPPSTWAAAATIDKNQPWGEEDTIEPEQVSSPLPLPHSVLARLWSSLLRAPRQDNRNGASARSNAHRKALFARSTTTSPTASSTIPSNQHFTSASPPQPRWNAQSFTVPATFDKWRDINYALDAHGFYT